MRQDLLKLRKSIFETPALLRRLLKHPILPGEHLDALDLNQNVDFREHQMSEFTLKYLAKFICEYDIVSLTINGTKPMPMREVKAD